MSDDDVTFLLGEMRNREWVEGYCAAIQLAKECCNQQVKAGAQHMIRERIADRIHRTALAAARMPLP